MAIGAVALVAVVAPFTGCADDGSRTEVAASSSDGGDIADVLPFAETTTTTTTSAAPPPPTTQAFVAASPPAATGGDCHPSYDPCLPVVGDLDCPDIGHRVRVIGPDDYRLDREGDGVGCESY